MFSFIYWYPFLIIYMYIRYVCCAYQQYNFTYLLIMIHLASGTLNVHFTRIIWKTTVSILSAATKTKRVCKTLYAHTNRIALRVFCWDCVWDQPWLKEHKKICLFYNIIWNREKEMVWTVLRVMVWTVLRVIIWIIILHIYSYVF